MGKTWSKRKRLHRKLAPKEKFEGQDFLAPRSGPEKDFLSLQRAAGNRATNKAVSETRREVEPVRDDPPPVSVDPGTILSTLAAGQPVPNEQKEALSGQLEPDVDQIQVHDDPVADRIVRSLGAKALSIGKHILFRQGSYQPHTQPGKELLAHEVGHIAAGKARGGTASAQPVQLAALSPDDVTEEMVGRSFILRSEQGSAPNQIPKGASVVIKDWKGTAGTATVEYRPAGKGAVTLDVPKLALEPDIRPVSGMRVYRAGIGGQQKAVEKAEGAVSTQKKEIEDWRTKESSYKRKPEKWKEGLDDLEKELSRRESVLADKEKVLSRMLLVETMYNRFDSDIKTWVDFYDKQLKPDTALDPNIVKSIIFQESRFGTSGQHLEKPPYDWDMVVGGHPIKSRFNIGQTIDSWPEQQLVMIKEMAPHIFTRHGLEELEKINRKKSMTNQEFADWEGGKFPKAIREFMEFRKPGGENLMGTKGLDLYEDYSFWIRATIRWLFFKYMSLPADKRTWEEAVRAYNGSGADARKYRKEVMSRVGGTKELNVGMK